MSDTEKILTEGIDINQSPEELKQCIDNFLTNETVCSIILKAEIDAFLHDLDKATAEFIQNTSDGKNIVNCKKDYGHQKLYDKDKDLIKEIFGKFDIFNENFKIKLSALNLDNILLLKNSNEIKYDKNIDSFLGEMIKNHHASKKKR